MLDNYETELKKQVSKLLNSIYVQRDAKAVMQMYSHEHAALKGMTSRKRLKSHEEITRWLEEILPHLPIYSVENQDFEIMRMSEHEYAVWGEMILAREGRSQRHTVTMLWRKREAWELCTLTVSAPELLEKDFGQMIGREVYNSYQHLDEKYHEKSLQLEMLLKSSGGGLAIMECTEDYPFVYVSESLCKMLGYTRKEFLEKCDNCFFKIEGISKENLISQLQEQTKENSTYQCEYKATHKNGDTIWIYSRGQTLQDNNGKYHLYGIFMDVTKQRNAMLQLRVEHLHNQIVLEMSGDIVLEYNCQKDTVLFRSYPINGVPKTHHVENLRKNFRKLLRKYIYHDDRKAVLRFLFRSDLQGSVEFQGFGENGELVWYRLTTRKLVVENEQLEVVGRIHNIDKQKWLENEANLDDLTRLYNRRYMNEKMQQILDEEDGGALIMMDIDSFKAINDNFGHEEGDKVLAMLANLLVDHFRKEDLICRVGGDEFLVFMRYICNESIIHTRCERLLKAFCKKTRKYRPTAKPSLSIGVAMVHPNCSTVEQLYRRADEMLYQVKRSGKNGIKIQP